MSFDYNGTVIAAANQYGIDPSIAFGLFQQESSNNPNEGYSSGGSSAYGPGQLTIAAANQVGVDRFDPTQNIFGSMHYLSEQINRYGGNVMDGLAAYNQGHVNSAGRAYASSVLNKAKSFGSSVLDSVTKGFNSSTLMSGAEIGLDSVIPGAGSLVDDISSIFGGPTAGGQSGQSCDFICEFQKWLANSGFFERIALAVLALLFVLGGLYLLKGQS